MEGEITSSCIEAAPSPKPSFPSVPPYWEQTQVFFCAGPPLTGGAWCRQARGHGGPIHRLDICDMAGRRGSFLELLRIPMPSEKAMAPPLQYSCLENPMDEGAREAAVHGIAEGQTRLSNFTFTFHSHALEKEMATHSSVLAWRIPGTGEPGGLPSMGSHTVGHD